MCKYMCYKNGNFASWHLFSLPIRPSNYQLFWYPFPNLGQRQLGRVVKAMRSKRSLVGSSSDSEIKSQERELVRMQNQSAERSFGISQWRQMHFIFARDLMLLHW